MTSDGVRRTPPETLDALFPLPTTRGGSAPALAAGASVAAAHTLTELLKDDYDRHHIFFDEKGLHNHATHHLYAIFALGAPPDVLRHAYETHTIYQRILFESPTEITTKNWKEHLGDEKYYRAYLDFFATHLLAHGFRDTLQAFVFAPSANWDTEIGDGARARQPQMFNRLLSGLLHPLIHVGHACEFGSPGMLAEGLAMACITGADFDVLIPRELFSGAETDTAELAELAASLSLASSPETTPTRETKPAAPRKRRAWHAFTLLARMLANPALAPGAACAVPPVLARFEAPDGGFPLDAVLATRGALVRKYAALWEVDGRDADEVREKIEELAWVVALMYGVGGWSEGRPFVADFFSMHLVTSSLFLPALVAHLSPSATSLLLRSFLAVSLSVWVARGRPPLPLTAFYAHTSAALVVPGPKPTPSEGTLGFFDPRSGFAMKSPGAGADGKTSATQRLAPNAWLPVLQSTILHPNEHLPKLQRALAHYARVYGYDTRSGRWGEWTELEGADVLDGTLFARVAGLTMGRLGWMREGERRGAWDFGGRWEGR